MLADKGSLETKNSKGTRMDLWGTPQVKVARDEDSSLITTEKDLSNR